MANKEREQAQRLAARGASVEEIKSKTGLSGDAARVVTSNWAPPPPSQAPVAVVRQTSNSNNPAARTLTINPVNGATQAQADSAYKAGINTGNGQQVAPSRQQAIKRADSLGQAVKIAASNDGLIGDKEIGSLLKRQGSDILKIRGLVNSLNTRLAGDNGYIGYKANAWNQMNKGQYDNQDVARQRLYGSIMDATLGSKLTDSLGWARMPDKGFQNLDRGASAYEIPGAGTQYGSRNNAGPGGWGKYNPSNTSTSNETPSDTTIGGNSQTLANDYIPPPEEPIPQPEMPGMMSGGGAGISSAMGIRRKKSSWKSQGTSTKGTSALNRGLTINSFNV